jgi:hypothetical protein
MNSIHDICKQYKIYNYTVNDDDSIDVDGSVDLFGIDLTELPLRFNRVNGNFICSLSKLTTLKGSPNFVGGYFSCANNFLKDLKYSPKKVIGDFVCSRNNLTDLYGDIEYVGGDFYCGRNQLIDNYSDIEINGYFYTTFKQKGLIFEGTSLVTNYKEWIVLKKRKKILNQIYDNCN